MRGTERYSLKWKGRESGPFSLVEIRAQLEQREISLMHEVFYAGEWITLRLFLRTMESSVGPAVGSSPAPTGVARAIPTTIPETRPNQRSAVAGASAGAASGPGVGGKSSITPASAAEKSPPPLPALRTESVAPTTTEQSVAHAGAPFEPGKSSHGSGAGLSRPAGFPARCVGLSGDLVLIGGGIYALKMAGLVKLPTLPHSRSEVLDMVHDMVMVHPLGPISLLVVFWLYFTVFESSVLQATPGKLLVGLRVIRSRGGNRLSFSEAAARSGAKLLSAIPAAWGFFLAAFTEHRQALHDVIAKCYVVSVLPHSSTSR